MNYTDRSMREIAHFSPSTSCWPTSPSEFSSPRPTIRRPSTTITLSTSGLNVRTSPLYGLVEEFYTQGGFSIGATVARHATDDEFDIDVMAQLSCRTDVDPEFVLSTLDEAIRAEPGSRYHDKADRKTRCSTVYYDGMHLDVTPTARLIGTNEKTGLIFHSKPEEPLEPKLSLHANPYGFAQWFIQQTPPDQNFGTFFEKRSLDYDRGRMTLLEKRPTPFRSPTNAPPIASRAPSSRCS